MKTIKTIRIRISNKIQQAYQGMATSMKIGNEQIIIVARNSRALSKVLNWNMPDLEFQPKKFNPTIVADAKKRKPLRGFEIPVPSPATAVSDGTAGNPVPPTTTTC